MDEFARLEALHLDAFHEAAEEPRHVAATVHRPVPCHLGTRAVKVPLGIDGHARLNGPDVAFAKSRIDGLDAGHVVHVHVDLRS